MAVGTNQFTLLDFSLDCIDKVGTTNHFRDAILLVAQMIEIHCTRRKCAAAIKTRFSSLDTFDQNPSFFLSTFLRF